MNPYKQSSRLTKLERRWNSRGLTQAELEEMCALQAQVPIPTPSLRQNVLAIQHRDSLRIVFRKDPMLSGILSGDIVSQDYGVFGIVVHVDDRGSTLVMWTS